jgi:hypothetical protein
MWLSISGIKMLTTDGLAVLELVTARCSTLLSNPFVAICTQRDRISDQEL